MLGSIFRISLLELVGRDGGDTDVVVDHELGQRFAVDEHLMSWSWPYHFTADYAADAGKRGNRRGAEDTEKSFGVWRVEGWWRRR
jgi:hypothetical protein